MTRKLIFCLILLSIFSCSNKSYLTNDDLSWQPYKVSDELIFESNKGESYKIYIRTIDKVSGRTDHLEIFPDYTEICSVNGEYTLLKPYISSIGKTIRKENISLLNVGSGKENPNIRFDFSKKDAIYYGEKWFDISELNDMKTQTMNEFKDVIILEDTEQNYYYRENHVVTIYWSKKYGYVRYDLKDGYIWELKKLIRNGENILPN